MKKKYIYIFLFLNILLAGVDNHKANSQVLWSILFGDKLNSDKLEFGLDGGLNFSDMSNSNGNWAASWNLGYYFYIMLNENSWIHTGMLVKSPFGVDNLYPYATGDEDVDSLMLNEGYINRNLRYFNVPITYCHYIYRPIFIEGGIMVALRFKAWDEFIAKSTVGDDIIVIRNIKDQVKTLDAGFMAGVGYKFQEGLGIAFGARYYFGLVNAQTDINGIKHKNSNLYFFVTIPIGKGKAEKRRAEKEQ